MLKTLAIIFGIIMLAVGLLGFVPPANDRDLLFGIFRVDFIHNLIHIATGIVSLLCGFYSNYASRIFFQIFGIIYGLITLLGLYYGNNPIFGLIAHNVPDILLHALISAASLYLGFFYHRHYDRDIHTTDRSAYDRDTHTTNRNL